MSLKQTMHLCSTIIWVFKNSSSRLTLTCKTIKINIDRHSLKWYQMTVRTTSPIMKVRIIASMGRVTTTSLIKMTMFNWTTRCNNYNLKRKRMFLLRWLIKKAWIETSHRDNLSTLKRFKKIQHLSILRELILE